MVIPTPTIDDVPKSERKKLQKVIFERTILSCAFSYEKIHKLLMQYEGDPEIANDLIGSCIVAHTEEEKKTVQNELNEVVSTIMSELDLKTVRSEDPFGRTVDCLMFDHPGMPVINKNKMIEQGPKYGISTEKIIALIEASTTRSPYTAIQIRTVREK